MPGTIDPSDFAQIEPMCTRLLAREINTCDDLRGWISDLSRLCEAVYEYGSKANIANACHTEDVEKERVYLHFIREIQPKLAPLFFELQKKYLSFPVELERGDAALGVMRREWQADVDIFREQNIPLQTREQELSKEYGKAMGAMTVEFRGATYTLQQLAKFQEEPDRETREQAWHAGTDRRLRDREPLDALFEQLLEVRSQQAAHAGFDDFRRYAWVSKKRFDYTPQDCLAFGNAVEAVCMPLVRDLDEQRKKLLSVTRLRPWDLAVDTLRRPPLKPFAASDIPGFVEKTRRVFDRISPELGRQFDSLREQGNLDLDSRQGKRPGGFQASLEASRQPFIFMNAAGLQRDVETLLHEGGHAFHYIASRDIDNLFVRSAPLEFCEVASMSMELLADDLLVEYYGNASDAARAKRVHLEGIIRILPWIATIDGYQHWLYTHPGHDRSQRTTAWLEVYRRFSSGLVDWSGLEAARESRWQQQIHLYSYPFYYIEYGIAQLGALGVWLNYRHDPRRALEQLLHAFSLGGTRPLPELFTAAGLRFAFDHDTIDPLIQEIREELDRLPQ